MRSWFAVALMFASVNCKNSRWNGQKTATELRIAGFEIRVPDGWRSLDELSAAGDHARYRPGPDSVGMMPERDREGVVTASVSVTASPRSAVPSWVSCAQAVENARAGYSLPIRDVHDGGSACTWRVTFESQRGSSLNGTVGIRIIGNRQLSAQCLIDAGGDGEAESVCDNLLRTLQMR
ncbi:MAG: hypothetical protein H0T42_04440 [Deltaproteobacteria bacterium]|nr:hypothetical protein [Deltaproteobacteria bacterium]